MGRREVKKMKQRLTQRVMVHKNSFVCVWREIHREGEREAHRLQKGMGILYTQRLVSVKLEGLSYVSLSTCQTDGRLVLLGNWDSEGQKQR